MSVMLTDKQTHLKFEYVKTIKLGVNAWEMGMPCKQPTGRRARLFFEERFSAMGCINYGVITGHLHEKREKKKR